MKKIKMPSLKVFLSLLGGLAVLNSCYNSSVVTNSPIQKRKYTNGFFVLKTPNQSAKKGEAVIHSDGYASVSTSTSTPPLESDVTVASVENAAFPADRIEVKSTPVIQFHSSVAKQTKEQSSTFVVNSVQKESRLNKTEHSSKTKIVKINKQKNTSMNTASSSGSGRYSQLVALLLAIFVGILGIHRFYLGYIGLGILELLTGGVCGILTLIDIIRIAIGSLGPKNGSYTDTL